MSCEHCNLGKPDRTYDTRHGEPWRDGASEAWMAYDGRWLLVTSHPDHDGFLDVIAAVGIGWCPKCGRELPWNG